MLAAAGISSRRRIEELVAGGRVLVNGVPAAPGQKIRTSDKVLVDGRPVQLEIGDAEERVLVYHKPPGEIVSRDDPQGRPSVFDHLPKLKSSRWIAVGRLDFNTSGLLILTTSGELANVLMHPGSRIEREYAVRVRGELSGQQTALLSAGIELDDGLAKFESIDARGGGGSNHWYHVVLHEGRNREVRRLFEAVELTVSRLMRVRFGPIRLPPRLRPGKFLELSPKEIGVLKNIAKPPGAAVGLESTVRERTDRHLTHHPRQVELRRNPGTSPRGASVQGQGRKPAFRDGQVKRRKPKT